jgi:hypothetical protein
MTTMTDGWKTKLHALSEQEPDEGKLHALVEGQRRPFSDLPGTTGTRGRLVAGIVALAVFLAVVSLAWVNIGRPSAPPADVPSTEPSGSDVPGPTEQVIG